MEKFYGQSFITRKGNDLPMGGNKGRRKRKQEDPALAVFENAVDNEWNKLLIFRWVRLKLRGQSSTDQEDK